MRETIAHVVCVLSVCGHARMLNSGLQSERRHWPCDARRILFALCCSCVMHLGVQLLVNNAAPRECALLALPASFSACRSIFDARTNSSLSSAWYLHPCIQNCNVASSEYAAFVCSTVRSSNVGTASFVFEIPWALLYYLLSLAFPSAVCRDIPRSKRSQRRIPCKPAHRVSRDSSLVSFQRCISVSRVLGQLWPRRQCVISTVRRLLNALHRIGEQHRGQLQVIVDGIARVFRICPTVCAFALVNCDRSLLQFCTLQARSKR